MSDLAQREKRPAATADRERRCYASVMCRSIQTLRRPDQPATEEEIEAAARQFVRKLSGYRVPSRRNAEVFDQAIAQIAEASRRLLDGLETRA